MKCYCNRFGNKLLNIPAQAPIAAPVNGKAYRILPDQNDGQTDAAQDYRFVSVLNVVGGDGQPAAQLFIQGSTDGVVWFDVASGTSRTAPGLYQEIIDAGNSALLPWVRARLALAGTTPPSVDGVLDIVSTGPFQLSST